MLKCPYASCKNRSFRTEKAVNVHLSSHKEPLPFNSYIASNQIDCSTHQEENAASFLDDEYDYHDDYATDMDDDGHSSFIKTNSNNDKNAIRKFMTVTEVDMEDSNGGNGSSGNSLKLNGIELRFARASLSAGLSKAKHTEFADIIQDAADLVYNTGKPLKISTRTLDGLFAKINTECDGQSVSFYEHNFDISAVHGIPNNCIKDFRDSYGTIKLVYRNIKELCELLFNYEEFWEDTILLPEIWERDGKRVVQDIHTARWWNQLQAELPLGAIVLALLLSSDETVVSGNNRAFAHPLYLKLGNTPKDIRNKATNRASRVLAYFPILHCPNNNNKLRQSWSNIKCCIIHYCLQIILAPFADRAPYSTISMTGPYNKIYQVVPALAGYIADLPEQRLMAGVKSGMATYTCPRCWTVTADFHLPYYNTKKRKTNTMKQICECGMKLIKAGKDGLAKELSKKYSTQLVDNAFETVPHFSIFDSLVVDTLHQLGGAYTHLVECVQRMLTEGDIEEINSRAKHLPHFREQRTFPSGYMLCSITSPTYMELRHHLSILLSLIHDKVSSQTVLCLRHFIDFFYQATSKEHSGDTIQKMQDSLKLYNTYSPAIALYSKHYI
ncbi:hypothetical protein BDC45DRAFT_46663 [Circinella umbellata]|nr:hypothetical protein BDC45DRAFT_46663 [Circinella umbellata]